MKNSKQINNAVSDLAKSLKLTGGSVFDVNLYQLNCRYLLDLEFRKKVNHILDKYSDLL